MDRTKDLVSEASIKFTPGFDEVGGANVGENIIWMVKEKRLPFTRYFFTTGMVCITRSALVGPATHRTG